MISSYFMVYVIFMNVYQSLDIRFTTKITAQGFQVCGSGMSSWTLQRQILIEEVIANEYIYIQYLVLNEITQKDVRKEFINEFTAPYYTIEDNSNTSKQILNTEV